MLEFWPAVLLLEVCEFYLALLSLPPSINSTIVEKKTTSVSVGKNKKCKRGLIFRYFPLVIVLLVNG